MPLRGLYAITDDALLAGRLLPAVEAALLGGCRIVQYRSKQADTARQHSEATDLLQLCRQHDAILLVNDNLALAEKIGADGVHLGQEDMSLAEARQALGNNAIIGITCHNSLTLAQQAQAGSANYVAFGRFFPSDTKQSAPPADLSVLQQARGGLHIPLVAIGGITLDNALTVLAAGADMLAVVGDLFSHPDIAARSRHYTALFT
ncbi:MAG TPA: thiamine phosphate synthase [Pseudomonadales bacterium]|nr:thiamine phosphate synthase [Pseudomonadales bacterium]